MYSARIEFENGLVWDLNPDSGVVFDIDPLNGIDVNLGLSQGHQSEGQYVESESVGGITRTIRGVFFENSNVLNVLKGIVPFLKGKLFFNDNYFCEFHIKKTPLIKRMKNGKIVFDVVIFCPYPYWYSAEQSTIKIGGYEPSFEFPAEYTEHVFGVSISGVVVYFTNNGVRQPININMSITSPLEQIVVGNALNGKRLVINHSFLEGDFVSFYRKNGMVYLDLTRNNATSSIFSSLDDESELFFIETGENALVMASENSESVQAVVFFNEAFAGVVDNEN